MTQRFTLGIQGRGQNPEKNDVIKSTDIFERDSLVPGQEPKLREDLTLTVEPNPAGMTQATQIQTTNTDDIMNHSVSLENHLWGTSLSLDAAVESLTKTADEFQQLKFARESNKSSLNEQFAFESIGDRLKAGIKKVIEYIRAFFKRMGDWIKGERGKAAKDQAEKAKAAVKKAVDERTLDEVLDQVYSEMFGEKPPADGSRNPFAKANDAGSFQKAANEGSSDVYKTFDEIIAGAGIIMKSHRDSMKKPESGSSETTIEEINRNSEKLSEELDKLYAAGKDSSQKFVNEVSRQNVNKFYRQFRDWYGKQNSVIVDEDGGVMAVKTASMEDIAKFIEEHDVEPEIGNALAQALRAAAKVAKFQEDRVKAEATTASAVLSIEKNLDKGDTTEGVSKENLTEAGTVEDGQDGAVNTGEGVAAATGEEGAGEPEGQTEGELGDISLNAPEYLEGEHEGQTEEETQAVMETRAEDLVVAAESLSSQVRVLKKLKGNRVISVGFVTESIQTLSENPFKDVRHYTQLPSRTNYDYSVESLTDKIKEGAKGLKEKIVTFLKRVWQWLKGFFVKQQASVEEVQAKAKEQAVEMKEIKAAIEEVGEVAKKPVTDTPEMAKRTGVKTVRDILREAGIVSPEYKHTPDPDKYTGPSLKVISFLDRGTTEEVVERIRMAQRAVFSANNMNSAMGIMARRFVEHVKSKNLEKATKLVELLSEKIADEEADGTKRPMGQEGYNSTLEKHLEKEASLYLLFVVAEHIDMERREFLGTIEQAAKNDVSVQTLADLTKAVEGMSEEDQGPFGSLVSKFTKDFLRASRKVNSEVASVLYNVDSIFPLKPLLEEINRLQKAAPDAKVPGFDLSNESFKAPVMAVEKIGKRVPFWERSSKKANAGRSVTGFSTESFREAPQWDDFAAESFGDLKKGAKALKDKFVAFVKRIIEWFRSFFDSKEEKQRKEEARAAEYTSGIQGDIRKAADATFPNIPTWELLRLESAEMPSILNYRYTVVFTESKKSDEFFTDIYERYASALKAGDVARTEALVEEYSRYIDVTIEKLKDVDSSTNKEALAMIPLLKAKASMNSLDKLFAEVMKEHGRLMRLSRDSRSGGKSTMEKVKDLMVNSFDDTPNEIMTGLHKLVTLNTKVSQVMNTRILKFFADTDLVLPYERISKALSRAIRDANVSTEGYQEFYPEFSVESIGSKIKEGALAIKEKLKKWISQFWNWLKGFFGNGKKKAEQVKAKVEQSAAQTETKFDEAKAAAPEQYEKPFEEIEELKPILEERAAPIKPAPAPSEAAKADEPEHKLDLSKPAATIAELLGYAYSEYPARQAAYSDRISRIVVELNTWLAKQSGDFIKAVEKGDQRLADSIANTMREESKKLDKMRQDFRVESSNLNQELVKLMASKPSAHGLRRAAQILTEMRMKMINEAEAQLNSSNKALDLGAYEQVLDKLTPDNQAVFIELIQRVVNNIQKFVKFDNVELNRTLQSIERDFPVGRINSYADQFMAKLKADLRNSVRKPQSGPANESYSDGNPFDSADLGSWAQFGMEDGENFGDRVKQGAKDLKDKLVALFKRVIEWLKNLFTRNKKNIEAIKAKVDAAQEKTEQAFESVKQSLPDVVNKPLSELEQTKALVENPPEPKPLTPEEKNGEKPAKPETAKQVYQLFGHYMPTSMGVYVLEYGNCIEAYRSAYMAYAKVVADIGAAVKQDDAEKLHQIVDAYEAQVAKETEDFDSFHPTPEQTDSGLKQLMEKTPSVGVLEEVHVRVREVYDKLLTRGVEAVTMDTSDSSVAAMSRLISEFMGSNHDLELLGRVTRTFTKWQTKVRTRYEGYSVTASTQIPVYHTYQILQRFKTDTGDSVANESLRKPTRRKPYWER